MRKHTPATNDKGGTAIAEAFLEPEVEIPLAFDAPEGLHDPETDQKDLTIHVTGDNPQLSPVYRWQIPGDRDYSLPVDITDAATVDEAKFAALGIVIGGDGTEDNPGRSLTVVERHWIETKEPLIVRDTEAITLGHEWALIENEKLKAEIATYAQAKRVFEDYGINPEDPYLWVNEQMDGIADTMKRHDERVEAERVVLADNLEGLALMVRNIAKKTGHAQPDPILPAKPDASRLTITAPTGTRHTFPDLEAALWTEINPAEPMNHDEAEGLHQILNDNNGIVWEWMRSRGSEVETRQMTAAIHRILTLTRE